MVEPIPDGYHSVTPYLTVQGVPELVDFLRRAFGAEETLGCRGRTARSDTPRSGSAIPSS